MKVNCFAVVGVVALLVSQCQSMGLLDGLSLLQMYGGLPSLAPPAPLPAPPAPPVPPMLPPPVYAPYPGVELPKGDCGCPSHPHCPNCLSMIKQCHLAKLLHLKKKLLEKKLGMLLAHCAHFNNHFCKSM